MDELNTLKDLKINLPIKRLKNSLNNAISDLESVFYKKDKAGRPDISEKDISNLINRLGRKLYTFLSTVEEIEQKEVELRKLVIEWISELNEYVPNTNPQYPTSLKDGEIAKINYAIKSWIKFFFDISEEDLKNV